MMQRGKRATWAGVAITATVLLGVGAPSAMAEGGHAISVAPVVAYGIHETGNTASGGQGEFSTGCGDQYDLNLNSFWQLPVTVGDHVTVDWEAVIPDSTCLSVYPIGTNDYGLPTARAEESTEQGSNGKQEMKFAAPASGNLILDFAATQFSSGCTSCAGPYGFAALLQHSLLLSLAAPTSVATNGAVTATVTQNTGTPVPNGLTFWLLARWSEDGERHTYQTIGASAGGTVTFPLGLPLSAVGHNVTVRAGRAEDAGYVETVSNSIVARVEWPVPVVRPAHHHRRHHHHHRHHRHHRHHHR
jgi:hypothetical protein